MKKDGKYRYTLQFGSETDEEYRAGELLESLGNKKSAVIIAALNEYLASHPELQSPYCKIEVKVGSNYNQEKMEQIIRTIVEEKMAMLQLSGTAPREQSRSRRHSNRMLQQCWTTSICLGEIQMSLLSPIVGSFALLRIFFQNNITTCTIRDSACTYAFFSFTYSFVKILV